MQIISTTVVVKAIVEGSQQIWDISDVPQVIDLFVLA